MKPDDLRKLLDAAYSTERQPAATAEYLRRSHEVLPLLLQLWEAASAEEECLTKKNFGEHAKHYEQTRAALEALDQADRRDGEGEK